MESDAVNLASDLLWNHWQSGLQLADGLPEAIRPKTRTEGYAIQATLEQRSASPLFGWKIAATSADGQRHIAVDGPLAGRLLAENVFDSDAEISLKGNLMRVAEAEFAFCMQESLPSRGEPYSVDEVVRAVATLHPAIEIPDSRYQNFAEVGAPQLLADNACAHLFVLGPEAPRSWRSIDLAAHELIVSAPGKQSRQGNGAAVLGDPRIALTWLANELREIGAGLQAGQVVTTGTCINPFPIEPGDRIVNDMGALGTVSARFV